MEDKEERQLRQALQSIQNYNEGTKSTRLKILKGDQPAMNTVQYTVSAILKENSRRPIEKLLAIKLAKDTIQTFNDDYISQFQLTVLPHMERIAMFQMNSKDEMRGRNIFSADPDEQTAKIGNSFFRLTLECLWVWSKWFPIDPDTQQVSQYRITFEKLIKLGVQFCKLEYFTYEEVEKHMPEQMVPTKILQECRHVIAKDIQRQMTFTHSSRNHGTPSPSRHIANQLFSDLRRELARDESETVNYRDRIKHALQRRSTSSIGDKRSLQNQRPNGQKSLTISQSKEEEDQQLDTRTDIAQRIRTQSSMGSEDTYRHLVNQVTTLNMIVNKLQNEMGSQHHEKKMLKTVVIEQHSQITQLRQEIEFQKEVIKNIQLPQPQQQQQSRQQQPIPRIKEPMFALSSLQPNRSQRSSLISVKQGMLKTQIAQISEARQNLSKSFGQSRKSSSPGKNIDMRSTNRQEGSFQH